MDPGKKLELLAPAKDLACGIAALHHGADAVYIGAPRFGAREAVGNSVGAIEKLAAEARIFGAKTYVALNTVLYDHELEEAEGIIRQVYEAGADALIVQDMGILEMDLPPIALHASTQANNFAAEKIQFLEAVGFKRAVLARELSLAQIGAIAEATTLELEAFVHGSLCVSLSGQCYMSYAVGGRSANRGACAQPCRKQYTLSDATGKTIIENKYLLSLRDLDRSASIRELAEAGVRSFKIEGRLKEMDYVKNITAYYRRELDRVLEERPEFSAASGGKTTFYFTPDPVKTFHRGATDYFLHGRIEGVANLETPKSKGEAVGTVTRISRDSFRLSGGKQLANNDGLTFVGRDGLSAGLKVNRVENEVIYPDRMNGLYVGAVLFRNYDHAFQQALGRKTAERKIPVGFALTEIPDGFELKTSIGNATAGFALAMEKIPANDPLRSRENILRQLAKSGDTPFLVSDIETGGNEKYFFTAQQLNELRRGLLEKIREEVSKPVPAPAARPAGNPEAKFPDDPMHFENNITNRLSMQFYRRHGLAQPAPGVERRTLTGRLQVMITKHCLQHELGFCPKFGGSFPTQFSLPFFLEEGANRFELEFDCRNCLMRIYKTS